MTQDPIIVIGGPTASGKSALAVRLAEALGGTVINADALQLYADLPILTAQPEATALALVPHRLYGVLSATERSTAARWRAMAVAEIAAIREAGRRPIVVGGTGLYLKALLEGLAPVPAIPAEVRDEVRCKMEALGPEAFHAELASLDPEMAARLAPSDRQRLARAYEVRVATGRSLADWWRDAPEGSPMAAAKIVLLPEKEALTLACAARTRAMVAAGVVAEVAALLERGLDSSLPIFKAVGLKGLARHLAGSDDLETALAGLDAETRRYAKRQRTWFRHQISDAHVVTAQLSERIFQDIFTFIRQAC